MKTSIADIVAGLDLSAEEKAQAIALLGNEKVRNQIDGELKNVQSEFSRTLDESRTKVAQAEADKNSYYGRMSEWKTKQEGTLKDVQEQARKDRESAALLRARMESLTAAGVLNQEDWDGLPANTGPTGNGNGGGTGNGSTGNGSPSPDPNEGKYVTQQEGLRYLQYTPTLLDLHAAHQRITGKPLENSVELVNESISSGKSIQQVWEEKYGIPKLREEMATRAQKDHDDKIRREERTQVMSELQNPTTRPANGVYNSPVLVAAESARKTSTNSIPNVGSRMGVERAMAAHAAGRYEGGVVHNP
jgi:hypothetical protein